VQYHQAELFFQPVKLYIFFKSGKLTSCGYFHLGL